MIDKPQMVSTEQAFTTDAVSEYSYDLGAANKQIGHSGKPLVMHVVVTTAFTGGDSGVRIHIVDSDAAALTSDRALGSCPSENCSDDCVIPIGDLDAIGDHLQCLVPPGIKLKRYLGAHVVPVSEALATGDMDIWFDDAMEPAD